MTESEKQIRAFLFVRDIAYGDIGSRNPMDVLEKKMGTCSGKHALLKLILEALGYEVQTWFAKHDFSKFPIHPWPTVLEEFRTKTLPDFHDFLKVKLNDHWITIDAIFDAPLIKLGFTVQNWDGTSNMRLPVLAEETFQAETDVEKHKKRLLQTLNEQQRSDRKLFLSALTTWLQNKRKSTPATAFIFHGYSGHSKKNWFPWLRQELEQSDYKVIVPDFPHTDHPKLDEWVAHFSPYKPFLTKSTILIGHSLGGAFALRLLEQLDHPIKATFLVSPVPGPMGNDLDPLLQSFINKPFDVVTIRKNTGHITLFHANNDPYIRLPLAEELAKNLGTNIILMKNGGHLNEKSGFKEFPLLRDAILAA